MPATATSTTRMARRPNIVFLFSDDHAAHALSAYRRHLPYGAKLPETPNLDRLAASGMLFTNAFVTNAICAPSRATILTGQYGHLNGVMTNAESLHTTATTFPMLLRDAGYETALFGKWHLKAEPRGFDRYEIMTGQGTYYNPILHTGTDTVRHTGYTNDVISDRAIDWMRARRSSDKPLLMMVHFNAAHRYWDPGPEQLGLFADTVLAEPATFRDDGSGRAFRTRDAEMTIAHDLFARDLKLEAPRNLTPGQQAAWDRAYGPENAALASAALSGDALTRWKYQRFIRDYMRAVLGLDAAVGRVLDAIDGAGMGDNTLVVYTSDQGFFLGDHGWFDKRWMYEESLRTPMLARWTGVVTPGSVNRDFVMNLDLAQTFLELGGVAAPASMQGASIAPLFRGRTPRGWRDAIYYQYFEYPGWHMVHRQYGVRTSRYKLIHFYEVGKWELFDLARDPDEMHSVHADPQYATVLRDMEARLRELRAKYRAPAEDPVPRVPWDNPMRRPVGERPAAHGNHQ